MTASRAVAPLGSARGDASRGGRPAAAMTVDVEDWFHVENLRRAVPADTWHAQEPRVEQAMERMLALLDRWNVKATCFVLGWVADRVPQLVRRIAEAGHEIASHGHGHQLVHELTPVEFRADVERSKHLLEEITGRPVRGYRAPCFSLTDWALPVLREVGYEYDSSFFPTSIAHTRYGRPGGLAGRGGIADHDGLREVGLSCLEIGRHALPWAGGGYFRLLPYTVFRLGVRRILGGGAPYVFYIHPWEIDPAQPRVNGLRRSERMRHYLNLEKTEARLGSLLRDFEWTTIEQLLLVSAQREQETGREPQAAAPPNEGVLVADR